MRHAIVSLLILFSLLLASCSDSRRPVGGDAPSPMRSASTRIGPGLLDGLNAREALALANKWGTSTPEVQSFVDTEGVKVTFKKSGKTVEVALPKDQLVVAFAPYISKTHPCEVHYMSGCQGELVETPVKVTATVADGTVLLDEEITTMKNGFLELWLPRNQEITVTMEALGRKAEGRIGTFSHSNTCITTFQLL
jgi:predicted small secreted protein